MTSKSPEPTSLCPNEMKLLEAILGPSQKQWSQIVIIEKRHGFPRIYPLNGERYWPAVKLMEATAAITGEPALNSLEIVREAITAAASGEA